MQNPVPIPARLLALFGLAWAASAVSAQIMLSPVAVLGSDLGEFNDTVPLAHMIDHSGVGMPFVSGSTSFDTYFAVPAQTIATNGPANNWQSATVSFGEPLQGHVDFDLGASRMVSKLAIWNVAVKDVTVRVSGTPEGLATGTLAGSFRLTDHTSFSFSYPVDVLSFAASHQARYVRLEIASAYPLVQGLNIAYAIVGEVVASVAPAAAPTLAITREPDGDVTVTFTGTLQAAPTAGGTFENVPGNPQGSYTVPTGSLAAGQFFRAKGN